MYKPPHKKRYIPKHRKVEESIQRQVCTYLRRQYPYVIFFSDYAAGMFLTPNQAKIRASLQSSAGWPDLFIPVPVTHADGKHYCGLALELKRDGVTVVLKTGPRKGKLTTNEHIQKQAVVLRELYRLGYYANFAVGLDEAVKIIDWYFEKPQNATIF